MSAILSSEDLNDFISPGVACIKPVETLPKQRPSEPSNPYEVTTEDRVAADPSNAPPAQISLTDCLACSGCVTSAEAVLISLQSHEEVLSTLDKYISLSLDEARGGAEDGKIFVASVSPQARASLAATYGVSEKEAGHMIEQLLSGPQGIKSCGRNNSAFTWVLDTNTVREICQTGVLQEVEEVLSKPRGSAATDSCGADSMAKLPVLASACPGWICYAEKTHPHVLPHLSRLKSPQAMMGTILKSVLSRQFGIAPDKVWHVAVMPCFDKKLEASREELTDVHWKPEDHDSGGIRDVDCVITARELLILADSRGISFPKLPRTPLPPQTRTPFPDSTLDAFLFPRGRRRDHGQEGGPSGGYAYHVIKSFQAKYPESEIFVERGRNVDVVEYSLKLQAQTLMKTARYYGFRNIQNLVRRLKPPKRSKMPGSKLSARAEASKGGGAAAMTEYAYIEVMACPGGCTNGGGQIKASDLAAITGSGEQEKKSGPQEQKEWLARVDEAYYSADSSSEDDDNSDPMDTDLPTVLAKGINGANGVNGNHEYGYADPEAVLNHWSSVTGIERTKLVCTGYRQVESDVGKDRNANDMERVAGLASSIGGGW